MSASSTYPHIPDEMLSAYLDGAVSADERENIELALQGNAELKWRLETLRQTVLLLRALPAAQSHRNFSLETILAAERTAQKDTDTREERGKARSPPKIQNLRDQSGIWSR